MTIPSEKLISPPRLQPDCGSFTSNYNHFECNLLPANIPTFQSTAELQSHLSLFSLSPWFQSTAEPSESFLIITLILIYCRAIWVFAHYHPDIGIHPANHANYQVYTGSDYTGTRRLWRIRQWHIQSVSYHGSHWESTSPMNLSIWLQCF